MCYSFFRKLQGRVTDPWTADVPGTEFPTGGTKVMDDWRYTDEDLERLSLIMTLHDIGFKPAEVEHYMNLVLEGKQKDAERLKMLDKIREKALDEIHFREKQLSRLDYLRYEIRNRQDKK